MTGNVPSFSGRTLGGKYLVGELLGRGGYGAVYAAVQRDLGRPVAIKILHGELAYDAIMRFEREARAAAALGHPNIAQVTDFSAQSGEPPFLVMEMLPGETWGAVLRRMGRMPAARVAWIAHQVLAALDAAHRAGIVHRDVKPDNVFLVSSTGIEDFVKLLDFGIAKLDSQGPTQLTATGAMLGSPAYMAPEQVKGQNIDPRTDLYAVGATMYLALTGRLPFDAPSMHALLYAITESQPIPLSSVDASIDPRLIMVVERAMQKDPAMRFQSAAEMRGALDPFAARGVSHAPAISVAPSANFAPLPVPMQAVLPYAPTPPPSKSSTGAIAGILAGIFVVLLVLVGIGVLVFLRNGDAPTSATAVQTASASASVTSTPPTPSAAPTTKTTSTAGGSKPGVVVVPPKPGTDAGTTTVIDAGAPAVDAGAKKQLGGTAPRIGGGTFGKYDIEKSKASIDAIMPSIRACYVATEFDPPDHQFTNWVLVVDPAGNVKNVHRKTDYQPHPKLDVCLQTALRAAKLEALPGGGEIDLALTARTKDNP